MVTLVIQPQILFCSLCKLSANAERALSTLYVRLIIKLLQKRVKIIKAFAIQAA